MQIANDLPFPPWVMLFAIVVCVFALLLQRLGPDFTNRLARQDSFARRFGIGVFCFGLALAFTVAFLPYLQVRRHEPKVIILIGSVGFPIVFVLAGLIYIIAGKKGRSYLPSGLAIQDYCPQHWVTTFLILILAVVAEIAFERHIAHLGYRVIGSFR